MLWARLLILAILCTHIPGCSTARIADWHHTVVFTNDRRTSKPAPAAILDFSPARTGDKSWLLIAPPVDSPEVCGFAEALVSWNIDVAQGSAASIDIRVRKGAFWSPWLRVGVVGDSSLCGPAIRKFEDSGAGSGRIDVDFFVGDGSFDAAQVAVMAMAPEGYQGECPANVHRLGVCLSSATHSSRPISSMVCASETLSISRSVPFRSQRTPDPHLAGRLCSPTSVAMTLAYFDRDRPVSEIASRAYDSEFDLYGNWPRNVQAAWELGVPGYLTRFNDWTAVSRQLESGPIVASIRAPRGVLNNAPYKSLDEGHLIVLTGLDGRGGVFVNDPAAGSAEQGQRVYSMHDLTTAWMSLGSGTAYILGPVSQVPASPQSRGTPDHPTRSP